MTTKDKQNIRRLFYFHRYNEGSLGRLYGTSQQRISIIILEQQHVFFSPLPECLICGIDTEVKLYYIDGNEQNNKPQNVIMLCEMDKRRIEHLQVRRNEGIVTPAT